jgi:hypothetical protein
VQPACVQTALNAVSLPALPRWVQEPGIAQLLDPGVDERDPEEEAQRQQRHPGIERSRARGARGAPFGPAFEALAHRG